MQNTLTSHARSTTPPQFFDVKLTFKSESSHIQTSEQTTSTKLIKKNYAVSLDRLKQRKTNKQTDNFVMIVQRVCDSLPSIKRRQNTHTQNK